MLIEHPQLQRFLDLVTTGPTTDSKDEIFNPWRDYRNVRHPSYGGATEFRKHVHALRDELRAN
jgi:hypothetical protein